MQLVLMLFALTVQSGAGRLGVEVSDRPGGFVDLAKTLRPFQDAVTGKPVPVDSHGWPKADGFTVLMDDRPAMAWAPPIDDPAGFQPDESGAYHLSFHGRASVQPSGGSPVTVSPIVYDRRANLSSLTVTLPKGAPNLIVLQFSDTHRTPASASTDGITDLKAIRPGYPSDTSNIFTDEFLRSLRPFSYLRVMGWLDTNYASGYYGDSGHHLISWSDRTLPTDASQGMDGLRPGTHGIAWEYAILLANQTGKDLWINVPISATGWSPADTTSYVYKLAELIKNGDSLTHNAGLKPGLNLYIEHSNEVWNYGFSQYIWNKLDAIEDVKKGGSVLNSDGTADQEKWAARRHAQRLYQIARIFERVLGNGSLNSRIRPVYAHWGIFPDQFEDTLAWMKQTYGNPGSYFYALAGTAYFSAAKAGKSASVGEILAAMREDSDAGTDYTVRLRQIASRYGLKLAAYEAGPDNGGGDATNVGNRILANRSSEMGALVIHNFRDNFFGEGGDLATYFALSSGFSRWGCWGATEDLANLNTPKYKAIIELVK